MNLRAFVIHLRRAKDRRPQVERLRRVAPVDTDVVGAVDAATLDDSAVQSVYRPHAHRPRYPFHLRTAEVACFLSHRKCWRLIVEQKLDAALILEDDVELDLGQFTPAWNLAVANLRADDFIRFPQKRREKAAVVRAATETHALTVPEVTGLGMICQLVTHGAAEKLLAATLQFDRPVDAVLQMPWLTGVRPATIFPAGATECSAQLGGSRIQARKSWADVLRREILRPIYRQQLAGAARRSLKQAS